MRGVAGGSGVLVLHPLKVLYSDGRPGWKAAAACARFNARVCERLRISHYTGYVKRVYEARAEPEAPDKVESDPEIRSGTSSCAQRIND